MVQVRPNDSTPFASQAVTTSAPKHPETSPRFARSPWTNVVARPLFALCAVFGVLLLGSLVTVTTMGAVGAVAEARPTAIEPPISLASLMETAFVTSTVALILAVPIGVLAALYLSEFASLRASAWLDAPLRFLARVPPIVYGYFAVATFLPALGTIVPGLDKRPALGAGIALAGMIVPRFLEQSRTAIAAVSPSLRDAACALGASKFATAMFVVVPAARRHLLAALMLAASRAFGETMIVLIVFTAHASSQLATPATLTTFLIPKATTVLIWGHQVPREFFMVGCVLLFIALTLDVAPISLDKPLREEGR